MCIPMNEEIARAGGGQEALEVIHSHFEPKFLAEKSERREQKVRRDMTAHAQVLLSIFQSVRRPSRASFFTHGIGSRPTTNQLRNYPAAYMYTP